MISLASILNDSTSGSSELLQKLNQYFLQEIKNKIEFNPDIALIEKKLESYKEGFAPEGLQYEGGESQRDIGNNPTVKFEMKPASGIDRVIVEAWRFAEYTRKRVEIKFNGAIITIEPSVEEKE